MTRLPALLVAAALLTGCASADTSGLSESAADALQADVAAVKAGIEAKDGARSRDALKQLRAEVERQLAAGEITQDRADEIYAAAEAVPLPAMPVIARPTPTPTRVATTTVRRPSGEGKGKGKGDDKDDD